MNGTSRFARRAQALRDAAAQLTAAAAAGEHPEQNRLLAAKLNDRAIRVAAGEDDHSGFSEPVSTAPTKP